MQIAATQLHPITAALSAAQRNAKHQWQERRGYWLQLSDEEGRSGWGEASPLPGYSRDGFQEVGRALRAWRPSAPCSGLREVGEEAAVARQLEAEPSSLPSALEWVRAEVDKLSEDLPSARFALETALLDLLGRRLRRPIWALLSGPRKPPAVQISALLEAASSSSLVDAAHEAWASGYRTVKVKIGQPGRWQEELASLRLVRAELPAELALRLDANGNLPATEVRPMLLQLASLQVELIEEPSSLPFLAELHDSPVPLAADESLTQPGAWQDLERLRSGGVLRAVVLKPTILGGSLACLDLARQAAGQGVEAVVSHTLDGPVALWAAAHLALALPGRSLACGLKAHSGLQAWPPAPALATGSVLTPPQSSGLGWQPSRTGQSGIDRPVIEEQPTRQTLPDGSTAVRPMQLEAPIP